jgi:hypothetical protein
MIKSDRLLDIPLWQKLVMVLSCTVFFVWSTQNLEQGSRPLIVFAKKKINQLRMIFISSVLSEATGLPFGHRACDTTGAPINHLLRPKGLLLSYRPLLSLTLFLMCRTISSQRIYMLPLGSCREAEGPASLPLQVFARFRARSSALPPVRLIIGSRPGVYFCAKKRSPN